MHKKLAHYKMGAFDALFSQPQNQKQMESLTKQTHILIFAMITWFVWLCLVARTVKGTEEGFDYDPCSARGPKHWGELKEEWANCTNGKIQSPISLSKWTSDFNPGLSDLWRNHRPANAFLRNEGHAVAVDWIGNAGSIKIKNIDYRLDNYHWHHPSEHTQDGKTFPLELHMVHINNNPYVIHNIAVVAVLFEYGPSSDPFIYQIESDIQNLNIQGGEIFLGLGDPRVAKLDGKKYFRYIGSLTTPPCTEGVIWTVMDKVQTVAPYQVELLKQAVVGETNARPLQNINGRNVFYYGPYTKGSAAE